MNRKKLTSSTEEDWEAWLVRRWKWLVLGLAVAVLVGIVSLVIVLNAKERDTAAKEIIDKLKECLNGTEIHEDMTELVVPSNRCNNNSLDNIDLGRLKKLKTIEIEDNAFQDVLNMKLSGLADLERLIIGRNSFMKENGMFVVEDCDSVKEIRIGDNSFKDYSGFEVKNVPSLEQLVIGNNYFGEVEDVSLNQLKKVETVEVGENSFGNRVGSFSLVDCDAVKVFRVGNNSFSNYYACEIQNVPLLELIEIGNGCFGNVPKLALVSMSKLDRILIGEDSFTRLDLEAFSFQLLFSVASEGLSSFLVKDCPLVTEMRVGFGSFLGYEECVIDNVPSLEVIEIGSSCFVSSSIKLISTNHGCESGIDLPVLTALSFGSHSFMNCTHALFESGSMRLQ